MSQTEKKVVVITGGAKGMGRVHAEYFAKEGYAVVLGDLDDPDEPGSLFRETIEAIKKSGVECLGIHCNVCLYSDVANLVAQAAEHFGHIDVVIANAGVIDFGMTWELEEEQVLQLININLVGAWRTDKAAVIQMLRQKSGKIINISSTAGLKASPNLASYAMSKWGIIGLTKTLAKEVASYGINVNAICPTLVRTTMTEDRKFIGHVRQISGKNITTFNEADAAMALHHPLHKGFLAPEDISNACLWLASKQAKFLTGTVIPIDAGSLL
jgi:NAD(P)-dependent dehydrogenase (short-subunit alcohol dehydrogenase family)